RRRAVRRRGVGPHPAQPPDRGTARAGRCGTGRWPRVTPLLVATLAGALLGAGLLLAARGAMVKPAPLGDLLADLHRPRTAAAPRPTSRAARAWAALGAVGLRGRAADLAVCERTREKFVIDRLTWAAIGTAAGSAALALRPIGLLTFIPVPLALAAVPAGAVAGWFYALEDLRTDAVKYRREFVHSLAAYLELTAILMAGGAGVETALHEAAS